MELSQVFAVLGARCPLELSPSATILPYQLCVGVVVLRHGGTKGLHKLTPRLPIFSNPRDLAPPAQTCHSQLIFRRTASMSRQGTDDHGLHHLYCYVILKEIIVRKPD
ncbi:uncharacterized protein LOC125242235 isoform X2 [Leguminivora glycinivorella]|uniref:uncharacterized protein LOC125242235 isoform X2 n=1 Tax=Leguminivora glycinivorella TaxID=1035111 RepID=UPI00200BCABA|nr:uncharacterized protein LOC125242235 isoform X2 [Leguminivora glycinivorella]